MLYFFGFSKQYVVQFWFKTHLRSFCVFKITFLNISYFLKASLNLSSHPKRHSILLINLGETTPIFVNSAQKWCKYCQITTSPININSICSNDYCSSKEPTKVIWLFLDTWNILVAIQYGCLEIVVSRHISMNSIGSHGSEKGFVILSISRKKHDYCTELEQELAESKDQIM